MRRLTVTMFLFAIFGVLLLSALHFRFPGEARAIFAFELALFLTLGIFSVFYRTFSRKSAQRIHEERAKQSMIEASKMSMAWKDARSKIPRDNPRRESGAVSSGMNKLSAVRSMAVLLRSQALRNRVLEICDLGDSVLETIRRMPNDTPAAVAFADKHLTSLYDVLECCFKSDGAKPLHNSADSSESESVERFNIFISLFCVQQESILAEGSLLRSQQQLFTADCGESVCRTD